MAYSRSLASEVTVPGKSCDTNCEVNFLDCYKTCKNSNCLLECSENKNVCQTNCNDEVRPLSERMGSNILIIHRKVFHKKIFLQFFFEYLYEKTLKATKVISLLYLIIMVKNLISKNGLGKAEREPSGLAEPWLTAK